MRLNALLALTAVVSVVTVPLARAATKAEYSAATVNGLREEVSFGRAKVAVKKVLDGSCTF
jgi:hypothetical protein